MKNLTLCWPNYIPAATLSGGSFMSTLPRDNIKDPRSMYLARFIDCAKATTVLQVDLGRARVVGGVGLINVNFSATARYRWLGYSVAGFYAPVYTGAWIDAWPDNAIPMSLRNWEDANFWSGIVLEEARAGQRNSFISVIPEKPVLRYWKLEIEDDTNPSGYLHIGNAFIGDAWTLTDNFSWGDALSFEDDSQFENSLSRDEYADPAPVIRLYDFEVGALDDDEVYARVVDMQRSAGITSEMLVIPDFDDVANSGRRNFRCRFKSLAPVVNENVLTRSAKFLLKEIR